MYQYKYSKHLKQRSRSLRQRMTNAEVYLWSRLRSRQIEGSKFRRQFPIDNYIVDFICLEGKLIIELDGDQHDFEENVEYDKKRTMKLEKLGYTVRRFSNFEVFDNLDGVLLEIVKELNRKTPS